MFKSSYFNMKISGLPVFVQIKQTIEEINKKLPPIQRLRLVFNPILLMAGSEAMRMMLFEQDHNLLFWASNILLFSLISYWF